MNLIMVVSRVMAALRAGEALADPALWKNRQAAINAVTVAITAGVALASAFGYSLPVNADGIAAIAYAVVGIVTIYLTYATSSKVGLLPAKESPNAPIPAENGVSSAVSASVASGQEQQGKVPDLLDLVDSSAIGGAGHAPVVRDASPAVGRVHIPVGSYYRYSYSYSNRSDDHSDNHDAGSPSALPSVDQPADGTDGDDTQPNYSGNGWGDK